MEVWKDVVGYEDYFQVSTTGNVRSKRTSKVLKLHISKSGYITVSTKIGGRAGKCVCLRTHRVVAEAFLHNEYNKPYVNHIDGDKTNNCVENLEWVTASENSIHARSIGLASSEGAAKAHRKLTVSQAEDIRKRRLLGGSENTVRKLASEFGVGRVTIYRIEHNLSYTKFLD